MTKAGDGDWASAPPQTAAPRRGMPTGGGASPAEGNGLA